MVDNVETTKTESFPARLCILEVIDAVATRMIIKGRRLLLWKWVLAPTVPVQAQWAEPGREVGQCVEHPRRAREGEGDSGDRSRCGRG